MRGLRIDEIHDHVPQYFPINGFGCVVGEAGGGGVTATFGHNVG